jgi:hypothetical protein
VKIKGAIAPESTLAVAATLLLRLPMLLFCATPLRSWQYRC